MIRITMPKYVIIWFSCYYDDVYDPVRDDYVYRKIVPDDDFNKHMEIFDDETKFLSRKRELEDDWENCEIEGCYNVDLTRIKI